MPFNRPTLTQLKERNVAFFETNLPNADTRLPASFLNVLLTAHAGAIHGLYGYLEWLQRQCFVTTAEATSLDNLHGAVWGISRKAASKASGTATITGTNAAILPVGTLLQRGDGGQYRTTTEGTVTGGTAVVSIEAVASGVAGNLENGATLTLVNPVSGINASATAGQLTGGNDAETDEAYRERIIARIQAPAHGGNATDYEAWAKAVPGVTRVFVSPQENGAGSVVMRFMMDDTYSDGIPLAGDVTAVANAISPLKPVTAEVFVVAPSASPLNFTIQLKPNTLAVRNAVEASVKDYIRDNAVPNGTLPISQLREAISTAAGEADHVLTSPNANVTTTNGAITTAGTFSFSTLP